MNLGPAARRWHFRAVRSGPSQWGPVFISLLVLAIYYSLRGNSRVRICPARLESPILVSISVLCSSTTASPRRDMTRRCPIKRRAVVGKIPDVCISMHTKQMALGHLSPAINRGRKGGPRNAWSMADLDREITTYNKGSSARLEVRACCRLTSRAWQSSIDGGGAKGGKEGRQSKSLPPIVLASPAVPCPAHAHAFCCWTDIPGRAGGLRAAASEDLQCQAESYVSRSRV